MKTLDAIIKKVIVNKKVKPIISTKSTLLLPGMEPNIIRVFLN